MSIDYVESVRRIQQEKVEAGEVDRFGNGVIERLDGNDAKGYRFSNPHDYAYYDVYW